MLILLMPSVNHLQEPLYKERQVWYASNGVQLILTQKYDAMSPTLIHHQLTLIILQWIISTYTDFCNKVVPH